MHCVITTRLIVIRGLLKRPNFSGSPVKYSLGSNARGSLASTRELLFCFRVLCTPWRNTAQSINHLSRGLASGKSCTKDIHVFCKGKAGALKIK